MAAAIVVTSAGGRIERTAFGDGEIYRYVALNLDAESSDVHQVVVDRGASLRYGRIGLPAAMWALSAGHPTAIPWAHALLMVLSGGAATAAMKALFPRAPGVVLLTPFVAPGFPLSVAGGFAEALLVALCLWCVRAVLSERWGVAVVLMAASLLVKEAGIVVLLGLMLFTLVRHHRGASMMLFASILPVAAWYLYVQARYGHVPPFDPYLRESTTTIRPPGIAVFESIRSAASMKARVMAVIHLGLAMGGAALARTSVFALIAAAAGLSVLVAGPFAWAFIGEAARVFVLLQVFLLLAILARLRPSWVTPSATLA